MSEDRARSGREMSPPSGEFGYRDGEDERDREDYSRTSSHGDQSLVPEPSERKPSFSDAEDTAGGVDRPRRQSRRAARAPKPGET